jgi:hypothetical protein
VVEGFDRTLFESEGRYRLPRVFNIVTNEQIASETRTEITHSFPSVAMGSIEVYGSCCVLRSEIQLVGEEGKMRLFVCECCAGGKENGVFSLRSALEDVISVPYQFSKQLTRRDFNEMCEIKLTGKGLLLDRPLQSSLSFDFESRLDVYSYHCA